MEYEYLDSASFIGLGFEIPVPEFNGLEVPSFSFVQENYSSSYTTTCAARDNLLAPTTIHNIYKKSQTPSHHFHDAFSKPEDQNSNQSRRGLIIVRKRSMLIKKVFRHSKGKCWGKLLTFLLQRPAIVPLNGSWRYRADVGESRGLWCGPYWAAW